MSSQKINFNYCAQCKEINIKSIYNCQWLNLSFCRLKCLKQFYEQNTSTCDICKKHFHYNRIYLRDDVKNNDLFKFICNECYDQRTQLAVYCYYCAGVCYKGAGAQAVTTTGLISKYVCSDECKKFSMGNDNESIKNDMTCSVCEAHGKRMHFFQDDDQKRNICSTMCLELFKMNHAAEFGLIIFYFS